MRITPETSPEEIKDATKKVLNMPNFPNMKIIYIEGKHVEDKPDPENDPSFRDFLRMVHHNNTNSDNDATNN